MSAKHWAAWSAVLDQLRQTLRIAAKSLHQKGQMSADRLQQFNWSGMCGSHGNTAMNGHFNDIRPLTDTVNAVAYLPLRLLYISLGKSSKHIHKV